MPGFSSVLWVDRTGDPGSTLEFGLESLTRRLIFQARLTGVRFSRVYFPELGLVKHPVDALPTPLGGLRPKRRAQTDLCGTLRGKYNMHNTGSFSRTSCPGIEKRQTTNFTPSAPLPHHPQPLSCSHHSVKSCFRFGQRPKHSTCAADIVRPLSRNAICAPTQFLNAFCSCRSRRPPTVLTCNRQMVLERHKTTTLSRVFNSV